MFIDKTDERRILTQNLRNEIIRLRKESGYSANYFAINVLQKPQSWISQLETGKTKTISNGDLIMIFSALLSVSQEDAEDYLIDNYHTLFELDESNKPNEFETEEIKLYSSELPSEEDKYKERYDKQIDNLSQGLRIFYDRIDNKEDAVRLLSMILKNLHTDLGFSLSVASLPLFVFGKANKDNSDTKKIVFKELFEVIKKYDPRQNESANDQEPETVD